MADPTKYDPQYSYSGFQGANPTKPLPAPQVDNDFANVSRSVNETIDALKDIRRSDGKLKDGIVTPESMSPDALNEFETLRDETVASAAAAKQSETNSATSASNALQSENDTREMRDEVTAAVADFDIKLTNGLSDIETAKTGAVNTVNSAATSGVNSVTTARDQSLTAINDDRTAAQNAIATDRTNAVEAIATDRNAAETAIATARSGALTDINTSKENSLTAVGTAKNEALTDISTSGSGALTDIGTARSAALNDVNSAASSALTAIGTQVDIATTAATSASDDAEAIELSLQKMHGGTTGQVLTKLSNADNDFKWENMGGGGDMLEAVWQPIIDANTDARHSHANKTVLDNTTAAFTTEQSDKLAGIATGATANTGTVTSVGVSVPSGLTATGAITTNGTIAITYASGYQGYTTAEANKLADIDLAAYQALSQKNAPNGYAGLDAGGKLAESQLPAIAITDTFVVNSEAAMLTLNVQRGDIAVRTDLNKTFIVVSEPANVLANWQELRTPTDAVLSVNGRVGAVILSAGDVGAASVGDLAGKLNLSGGQMTGTALGVQATGAGLHSFFADTHGGSFADMRSRGAPFTSWVNHSGSSYAPALKISYNSANAYVGHWSVGVLNSQDANANGFVITHVNADGQLLWSWQYNPVTGNLELPAALTMTRGAFFDDGNSGGAKWEAWGSYYAFEAISAQIERRAQAWAVQEGRNQTGAFMTAERYPIGCCVLATISHASVSSGDWVGGHQISIANLRSSTSNIFDTGHVPNIGSWESLGLCTRYGAGMFKRVQ